MNSMLYSYAGISTAAGIVLSGFSSAPNESREAIACYGPAVFRITKSFAYFSAGTSASTMAQYAVTVARKVSRARAWAFHLTTTVDGLSRRLVAIDNDSPVAISNSRNDGAKKNLQSHPWYFQVVAGVRWEYHCCKSKHLRSVGVGEDRFAVQGNMRHTRRVGEDFSRHKRRMVDMDRTHGSLFVVVVHCSCCGGGLLTEPDQR